MISTKAYASAFACFATVFSGCAQLLGFDEVTPAATNDAAASDTIAPDGMSMPFCVDRGIPLGTSNFNTEVGSDDNVSPSCTTGSGNDKSFVWTAPFTDYYVFDTQGSNFDTVLSLQESCEQESEIDCNNNVGEIITSEIVQKIEADTSLIVTVDGFAGAQGMGQLNIQPVLCPDADLEGQTSFPLLQSTGSASDDYASTCGGDGIADNSYHWVAPEDGLYAFTATAPGFSPVVNLIDGTRCSDRLLGCNASPGTTFRSEVVRRLVADQLVSIVVDGVDGSGTFDLEIAKRQVTCPETTLTLNAKFRTELTDVGYNQTRTLAPSCGFTERSDNFVGRTELFDHTFSVTIPEMGGGCFLDCSATVTSPEEFVAYLLDQDDCGGNEVGCVASTVVNQSLSANLLIPAGSYTLVVATQHAFSANPFSVSIDCEIICAAQ